MSLKLIPYLNPDNEDSALIPRGWRFLYENEIRLNRQDRRPLWLPIDNNICTLGVDFDLNDPSITYIVPVNA